MISIKSTTTTLKTLVLPTLNHRYVFHAKFLKPSSKSEYLLLFLAFCTRKWRYQLSDIFSGYWHMMGHDVLQKYPLSNRLYHYINKNTTRAAADEYFFKQIPNKTEKIEFIYPSSLNVKESQSQLNVWIQKRLKYRNQILMNLCVLPVTVIIAKFVFLPAQILLCYQCFRLVASFRAFFGTKRLVELMKQDKVEWIPSQELQSYLETESQTYKCDFENEDISDDVIYSLQDKFHLLELANTYKRARLIAFYKNEY